MQIELKDYSPDLCLKYNKCKPRDNKFGVTWCVRCGKLFTTPSGINLEDKDKLHII